MEWAPLGFDPAPGDSGWIRRVAVGHCLRVQDDARHVREQFQELRRGVDSSIWEGDTATKFVARLPEVEFDLELLERGFRRAGTALEHYVVVLEQQQQLAANECERARVALAEIESATAELTVITHARASAESQHQSLTNQLRSNEKQRSVLYRERLQLNTKIQNATDEASRSALLAQQGSVTSRITQLDRSIAQVRAGVQECDHRREELRHRQTQQETRKSASERSLSAARSEAEVIRRTLRAAAATAAFEIRESRDTAPGSALDKVRQRVRESSGFKSVMFALDALAEAYTSTWLKTVIDILAWIPGLNVVFGPVSLIMNILVLGLRVASFAAHLADGRRTGWQNLAAATGLAMEGLFVALSWGDLKKGLAVAHKAGASALRPTGLASVPEHLKKVQQFLGQDVGAVVKSGTNKLTFTFLRKSGLEVTKKAYSLTSPSDLLHGLARGVINGRDVANAFGGKKVVVAVETSRKVVDVGRKLVDQILHPGPLGADAELSEAEARTQVESNLKDVVDALLH